MLQAASLPQADTAPRPAFMFKVFVGFAVLALLSGMISVAGKYLGHAISMAGHSDDSRRFEIVIGNNVLFVPGNEIRFERARGSGVAPRLDVYMAWPSMEGYSLGERDRFNLLAEKPGLIFASIEERVMSRDMSGRFEPIYSKIVEFPARSGPAGLSIHRLKENSGYIDEVLVVGPLAAGERFVARCLTGTVGEQSIAPCERDIHIGKELTLNYRFPRELLGEWARLESAVRRKAAHYLRMPAS